MWSKQRRVCEYKKVLNQMIHMFQPEDLRIRNRYMSTRERAKQILSNYKACESEILYTRDFVNLNSSQEGDDFQETNIHQAGLP